MKNSLFSLLVILSIFSESHAQTPVLTLPNSHAPYGLTSSGNELYMGTSSGISKIDITAPTTTLQTVTSAYRPWGGLANSYGYSLYAVCTSTSSSNQSGRIILVDLLATLPTSNGTYKSNLVDPRAICIVEGQTFSDVYYAEENTSISGATNIRKNISGTLVATINNSTIVDMVSDGTYMYLSDRNQGRIHRLDLATNIVTVHRTGLNDPYGLALAGDKLYFSSVNGGALYRIEDISQTSSAVTTLSTTLSIPTDIEIIGKDIYISNTNTGQILKYNDPTIPTCDPPTVVNVNPISADSVLVTWNQGSLAQDYFLSYAELGVPPLNGTIVPVTDTFYTLSGLSDTITYNVYIISNCSGGFSNWSDSVSFTTNTGVISSCSNIVTIPDTNFKAALLDHGVGITGTGVSSIDTDGDGEICQSEAQAYNGTINVESSNIADLTGIEAFTALSTLICSNNSLSSLDVSQNTALTTLVCNYNSLVSLTLPSGTALQYLSCVSNQLSNLDLSQSVGLNYLQCINNQLSTLNVALNTQLGILSCGTNNISSIDLSNNVNLTEVRVSDNSLIGLDLSSNGLLTYVTCANNNLVSLNIANGNNTSLSQMYAWGNPNLTCIQHDAGFDPTTTSWIKDATTGYSIACGVTAVPVTQNKQAAMRIYPNPTKGNLTIDLAEAQEEVTITVTNTLGQVIQQQYYETTQQLDLELMEASGWYMITIKTSDTSYKAVRVLKK